MNDKKPPMRKPSLDMATIKRLLSYKMIPEIIAYPAQMGKYFHIKSKFQKSKKST